jgi:hypothetical protein
MVDPETLAEIQRAIAAELQESEESYKFKVQNVERLGPLWSVQINPFQSDTKGLDESYEESRAWWPGPPNGAADVLSIVPEENKIVLRYATKPPPGPGDTIWIYPPVYLEALKTRWDDRSWTPKCLTWLQAISDDNRFDPSRVPPLGSFDKLRVNQVKAFQLLGWRVGFLWGPPGTGKSYTLGRMLAQYMMSNPDARALLLSTTNNAVDIALVYVDDALREAAKVNPAAEQVRATCSRLGNHFVAANYIGREHLLPVKDPTLVKQMVDLEAKRPDKEDAVAYGQWKEEVEGLRQAMRQQSTEVLERARLAATTTTRAAFTFEQLQAQAPYDLLVFDEASQVPVAMALALAPLARRALIAGDPQQLAPIVRSNGTRAQTWIGQSMFKYKDRAEDATCFLDEQSRMAETICKIVSNVFYQGKLKVAGDCRGNAKWEKERAIADCPVIGARVCHLERITHEGQWSKRYEGLIRHGSAMFIKDLVAELLKQKVNPNDLLVLTPFRAQRRLIRACLKQIDGLPGKKVSVSTVHRSQGTERHTIIFDPVQGENNFLLTDDAKRLINVAISRAKARFVLILSPNDMKNPVLRQVANVIDAQEESVDVVAVEDLARQPGFPDCAKGKVIKWGGRVGRVVRVVDEENKLVLLDRNTGAEVAFRLDGYRPKPAPLAKQRSGAHDLEARLEKARRAEAKAKTLGQLKDEYRLGWEKLLIKLGLPTGIGITRYMTLAQARALAASSKQKA